MTSRVHIARPAGAHYTPDPHGFANSTPSPGYRTANPDDPLEKVRAVGKQVEDAIEVYSQPLKPYLPSIGRFLIVATFYEDGLRIVTQWSDQLWYLEKLVFFLFLFLARNLHSLNPRNRYRHFYWGLSHLFLMLNVTVRIYRVPSCH